MQVSLKKPAFRPKIAGNSKYSFIGELLKKRRLELALEPEAVAKMLNVTPGRVISWENGHSNPQITYTSKIIEFLGYNPYPVVDTLGGRIKQYRVINGFSYKKLAKLLSVNNALIGGWEKDISVPEQRLLIRLEELLSK